MPSLLQADWSSIRAQVTPHTLQHFDWVFIMWEKEYCMHKEEQICTLGIFEPRNLSKSLLCFTRGVSCYPGDLFYMPACTVTEALNSSIESYDVYTGRRKLMPDTILGTFLTFSSSPLRGSAFWFSWSRTRDAGSPSSLSEVPKWRTEAEFRKCLLTEWWGHLPFRALPA